MRQSILMGAEGREELLIGINLAADVVKVTLGPKGKNVISHQIHGGVRSTKDGVSALNELRPDNQLHNAGVKIIRQAAQKTADEAGDSTTSTTILTQSMVNDANRLLNEGKKAVDLRKGIEAATAKCINWIKSNAIPVNGDVEKVKHIATISANNNPLIGELISEAFSKLGDTGEITLEDSKTDKCEIEILGGYHFNRGFVSPYFITNPTKQICELENPLILLYDKKISKVNDLLTVLEYALKNDQEPRSLLIIAHQCESEALGTLIANKMKGFLNVCVVQAPEQGIKRADTMEDMAIFTGGQVISEEKGTGLDRNNFKPEFLGEALKVIVKRDSCLIVNGQGDPALVEERQNTIKETIGEAPSDFEKDFLRKRAGSIGRGVAVLYIGASTDIERGDLKDLAEDAILATRAAIEEGYLPGGGVGFIRCAQYLKSGNLSFGENIVYKALFKPFNQILINNGVIDDVKLNFLHKFLKLINRFFNFLFRDNTPSISYTVINSSGDYGYNAKTDQFGHLISEGVIDASKVIRCAIENAASVAAMFLSTEVLVSEMPD